ncbi:MAG: hypothetical protein AB7V36_05815 [Bacteroidales bacterium]
METNRIIVGTYKTHPEEMGWYIAPEYQELFWKKIPDDYKNVASGNTNTFIYDKALGTGACSNLPNVFFFDLVKHDTGLNSSKDVDVLRQKSSELLLGLMQLKTLINEFSGEIRVGMVGYNVAGLIKLVFDEPEIDPNVLSKRNLKEVAFKSKYGRTEIFVNQRATFYLLENITSRYYKTHDSELIGWKSFWQ